ncbi:MAG TPA: hypothetical protein VGD91_20040 [Trebonia sp.]
MSLDKVTYLVAVCDSCGPDWWIGLADNAPVFLTREQARTRVVADYEWRIQRQLDGRFRMICATCADTEDCRDYGHTWPDPDPDDAVPLCRRCHTRLDNQPPAGHPDTMTPLPADQEALLATLDATLSDPNRRNTS